MGYISYDAARYWESGLRLSRGNPRSEGNFPDIQMGFYEDGIVFDHRQKKAFYFFSDRIKDRGTEIQQIIRSCKKEYSSFFSTSPQTNVEKQEFESSVRRAKEYIVDGEVFQVVLSKSYKFKVTGDLLRFYSSLRALNPSPYMYFLDMGEVKIAGSSPEMLARVESGCVETFPIAGTRPRSPDPDQDARLRAELLSDPKERAEHTMLVDLARNDIGRISEFGSVALLEFMEVHQFSHVQHIVSHVRGRLAKGLNCFDAMRSIFPAGTVSGAPKIRAMEIIDKLEAERRGPYAGAVGYFSYNGNMDSAITIRTLVADENEASIQTGAGIVADSDPEQEWNETERKASALLSALALASDSEQRVDQGKRKQKEEKGQI